jgi:hypothetical protein
MGEGHEALGGVLLCEWTVEAERFAPTVINRVLIGIFGILIKT